MIKASLGVMSVIVALALVIPPNTGVYAASAGRGAPSNPSSPSTPPSTSTPPGDPGNPGGGPAGGSGGNGGDLPTPPPDEQLAQLEENCNGALATLVKIPERMVVAYANEAGVSVIPICSSGLGHSAKIDASQAMPLQTAIGENAALMASLKAKGFTPDDVVGVVLLNGAATLYVHKHA